MNRKSCCCAVLVLFSIVACISAIAEEIQPPHSCELYTGADAEALFQQQVSKGAGKQRSPLPAKAVGIPFNKREEPLV